MTTFESSIPVTTSRLRDPKSTFSNVKEESVDTDELSLAKQLINGGTSKFDLSAYKK
jgi:non-homologous end joining protein Ku